MFSSEQNFTINGDDYRNLEKVIELALNLNNSKIKAFYKDKKGLVLCNYSSFKGTSDYPFEPTTIVLVEQIKQYIKGLTDEEVLELAGEEPDNDGTVRLGWEVFHPLWYGYNKIDRYELSAIIAVRPSWIVYGK